MPQTIKKSGQLVPGGGICKYHLRCWPNKINLNFVLLLEWPSAIESKSIQRTIFKIIINCCSQTQCSKLFYPLFHTHHAYICVCLTDGTARIFLWLLSFATPVKSCKTLMCRKALREWTQLGEKDREKKEEEEKKPIEKTLCCGWDLNLWTLFQETSALPTWPQHPAKKWLKLSY